MLKMKSMHNAQGIGYVSFIILLAMISLMLVGYGSAFKPGRQQLTLNEALFNPSQYEKKITQLTASNPSILPKSKFKPEDANLLVIGAYQKLIPEGALLLPPPNLPTEVIRSVTVQVEGNQQGTILDCQGHPLANQQSSQYTLWVNDQHQLVCQHLKSNEEDHYNSYVLVENVEMMNINFGEDMNGDQKVDRYISATQLQDNFSNILTLRLSLLIKTEKSVQSIIEKKFYTLQNEEIGPFEDKKLRKIYTTTIRLANQGF